MISDESTQALGRLRAITVMPELVDRIHTEMKLMDSLLQSQEDTIMELKEERIKLHQKLAECEDDLDKATNETWWTNLKELALLLWHKLRGR